MTTPELPPLPGTPYVLGVEPEGEFYHGYFLDEIGFTADQMRARDQAVLEAVHSWLIAFARTQKKQGERGAVLLAADAIRSMAAQKGTA